MATYRTIAATETDPEAPGTSALFKALADNPTAIAEGDPSAPRIQAAALDTSATMLNWLLDRNAATGAGVVGSYAFLQDTTVGGLSAGNTRAGSVLRYSSTAANSGGTPAGTWRIMGTTTAANQATLWLRIS